MMSLVWGSRKVLMKEWQTHLMKGGKKRTQKEDLEALQDGGVEQKRDQTWFRPLAERGSARKWMQANHKI